MLITEYRLDLAILALRSILPLAHPADTTLRYFFQQERIGSMSAPSSRRPCSACCATACC